MKAYPLIAIMLASLLLASCTSMQKEVEAVVEQGQAVTRKCNSPALQTVSSPDAIKDDLKQRILAQFGLAPSNGPGNPPSIQASLSKLKVDLAALEPAEQAAFKDALAAWLKLKSENQGMQASMNTLFENWKKEHHQQCQPPNFGTQCYMNTAEFVNTAAFTIQDDVVDLKTDLVSFELATNAAFKAAQPSKAVSDQITQDAGDLQNAVIHLYNTMRLVLHIDDQNNNNANDVKAADAIKLAVEDDLNKYIAYEASAFAMNEVDRVGRKIEVKLDEIDEKTWFILSGVEFFSSSMVLKNVGQKDDKSDLTRLTPIDNASIPASLRTEQTRKYMLEAAAALACDRLANESSTLPSDSSRAQILLYPLYAYLIDTAVPESDNGAAAPGASGANSVVSTATPPPQSPPPSSAAPNNRPTLALSRSAFDSVVHSAPPLKLMSVAPPLPSASKTEGKKTGKSVHPLSARNNASPAVNAKAGEDEKAPQITLLSNAQIDALKQALQQHVNQMAGQPAGRLNE